MQFKISTGALKTIVPGSQIMVIPGYLPPKFDDQVIPVVDVRDGFPFAQLEDDQLSAVDPQLISKVYAPEA